MNLQSQAMSTALALFPVYPPQMVTPVQPSTIADGGVSLSAFTPQGLEIVIEPVTGLLNWVVAAFDVVTLIVNNVRTNVSKTIMPGEESDRFLLYLAELWFTNGVNDVRYQVTRVSGNKDDSPTLQLLYHKPAPTITVSHPPSIGPGQTGVITIIVGYARPYDKVILTIGTWSITFNNPDPTKPITHTLTAAELQQIKDGTHSVFGRVFDQLFNSGVSTTTSITISANQPVLAIDPSTMKLDQISFFNTYDWPYQPFNERSATRSATGGIRPYIYTSGNPNIATVDGAGTVIARRNGLTKITVADAVGNTVSYPLEVSNIFQLVVNNAMLTADEARAWVLSIGGTDDDHLEYLKISHLANALKDIYDGRYDPDPLGHRWTQIQPAGMVFRVASGGGAYWPWGSSTRMRACTAVPSKVPD